MIQPIIQLPDNMNHELNVHHALINGVNVNNMSPNIAASNMELNA